MFCRRIIWCLETMRERQPRPLQGGQRREWAIYHFTFHSQVPRPSCVLGNLTICQHWKQSNTFKFWDGHQVAPLLFTENPDGGARAEKFLSGRCILLPCERGVYAVSFLFCDVLNQTYGCSKPTKSSTWTFTYVWPQKEPEDAMEHINDLIGINETHVSEEKVLFKIRI